MIFPDLNNLVNFLQVLSNRLNLYPRNFGIQPVTLITQTEHRNSALNTQCQLRDEKYDLCSAVTDNNTTVAGNKNDSHYGHKTLPCGNNEDLSSVEMPSNERLSRYDKWFRSQSISKRNDILSRKRLRSKEQYACQKEAKRKRQQMRKTSKDNYDNPEKAESKRQKQRDAYKDPKIANKKRQRARQTSKDDYKNPEKAESKRQKERDMYKNSEKAESKRQKGRDTYKNPEKAESKRQKQRDAYKDPEIANKKR